MTMKTITLFLAASLLCATALAADWDHDANVLAGARAFDQAYKAGGMNLVAPNVDKCYILGAQLPLKPVQASELRLKRMEFCASMDLAAFQVDSSLAKTNGFPATPYFTEELLMNRLNKTFDVWFTPMQKNGVISTLMVRVSKQLNSITPDSGKAAAAAPQGKYTGKGEGNLTLQIGAPQNGKLPVTLSTTAATAGGGRCGGTLKGLGTLNGDTLAVVADSGGERCEVTLKFSSKASRAEIEEGGGCMSLHGAACGFSGTVSK